MAKKTTDNEEFDFSDIVSSNKTDEFDFSDIVEVKKKEPTPTTFGQDVSEKLKLKTPTPFTPSYGVERLSASTKKGWTPQDQKNLVEKIKSGNLTGSTPQEDDYLNRIGQRIVRGMNTLNYNLAKTPEFVYNVAAIPQNIIAEKFDVPSLAVSSEKVMQDLGISNEVADYYKEQVNQLAYLDNKYMGANGSVVNLIKQGNYTDAAKLLGEQIAESMPVTASIAASGGLGATPSAITLSGGLVFGAGKYDELANRTDIPESEKAAIALSTGLVEGLIENIGTANLGRLAKEIITKSGTEVAKAEIEQTFKTAYKEALKKYMPVSGAIQEGIEEAATQFAQNAIDIYGGVDPNKKLTEGLADAFLVGTGSGAVISSPMLLAKKNNKQAQKIQEEVDQIDADLSNENVSEQAKVQLSEARKQKLQELNDIIDQDVQEQKMLPEESKRQIETLQDEIETITSDLQTVTTEVSKNALETRKKQLEKQIEEIINEPRAIETPLDRGVDGIEEGFGVAVGTGEKVIAGEDIQTEEILKPTEYEQEETEQIDAEPLREGIQGLRAESERREESPELRPEQEEVVSETVSELEPPVVEQTTADVGGVMPPNVSESLKDVKSTTKALKNKEYRNLKSVMNIPIEGDTVSEVFTMANGTVLDVGKGWDIVRKGDVELIDIPKDTKERALRNNITKKSAIEQANPKMHGLAIKGTNQDGSTYIELIDGNNRLTKAEQLGLPFKVFLIDVNEIKLNKKEYDKRVKDFQKKPREQFYSEAYHKAKADGSNPELVAAVEELLGQKPSPSVQVEAKEEPTPPQELGEGEIESTAKKATISPKNLRDLYKVNRELFGLDRIKSLAAAIAMDRMVGVMAKRANITKAEMYGRLKFEKDTEANVLKADNALFQGMVDGKPVTLRNMDVDVVNGFYSPLEKIISETKQEKMPAKQWFDKFARGEEAKWTGLQDWLSQQQGSISKQDILNYLKSNRISVVEVVKSGKTYWDMEDYENFPKEVIDIIEKHEDDNEAIANDLEKLGYLVQMSPDFEIQSFSKEQSPPKFSQYQLEGEKENYKEVLVTLPSRVKEVHTIKELNGKYYVISPSNEAVTSGISERKVAEERAKILDEKFSKNEQFKSSHFDEPNILVHLRMNTRTDADGNKVLFLEEVQSDWGQTGKKEGFRESEESKKREQKKRKLEEKYKQKYGDDWVMKLSQSETEELQGVFNIGREGDIPTAPFVMDTNAWTKLGLKVALKEAVVQGADKIAWTTGEQQNERYDLSKSVNRVTSRSGTDVKYVDIDAKLGSISLEVSPNGKVLKSESDESFGQDSFVGTNLSDVIGKEVADKIMSSDKVDLSGEGLKVGGKGMKGFYGSIKEGTKGIVGGVAEKLSGQKVGETKINTTLYKENVIDSDFTSQPSIDITPALRAEVERGLALFQRQQGQQAKGAMVAADGAFIIYALTDPNVSTPLHEMAHVFEHYLTPTEKTIVQEWAKTKGWTIETSEAFARGFEKYLAEGKAPSTALQKIFDKFKQWMLDIYNGITGSDIDLELNEDMRELYDVMLGKKGLTPQERTNLQSIADKVGKNFREVQNVYNKYGEGKPLSEITEEDYLAAEAKRQETKKEEEPPQEPPQTPKEKKGYEGAGKMKETGRSRTYTEGRMPIKMDYKEDAEKNKIFYEEMDMFKNADKAVEYLESFGDTLDGLDEAYDDMDKIFTENSLPEPKYAVAIELLANKLFNVAQEFRAQGNEGEYIKYSDKSLKLRYKAFNMHKNAGQFNAAMAVFSRANNPDAYLYFAEKEADTAWAQVPEKKKTKYKQEVEALTKQVEELAKQIASEIAGKVPPKKAVSKPSDKFKDRFEKGKKRQEEALKKLGKINFLGSGGMSNEVIEAVGELILAQFEQGVYKAAKIIDKIKALTEGKIADSDIQTIYNTHTVKYEGEEVLLKDLGTKLQQEQEADIDVDAEIARELEKIAELQAKEKQRVLNNIEKERLARAQNALKDIEGRSKEIAKKVKEKLKGEQGKQLTLNELIERDLKANLTAEQMANNLMSEMGYSQKEAMQYAEKFLAQYKAALQERIQKLLIKQLGISTVKDIQEGQQKNVVKPFEKTLGGQLTSEILAGALQSSDVIKQAFAKKYGLPLITREVADNLRVLAQQVNSASTVLSRRIANRNLITYLQKNMPTSTFSVLNTVYYVSLLSGASTAVVNTYGNINLLLNQSVENFIESIQEAVQGEPANLISSAKGKQKVRNAIENLFQASLALLDTMKRGGGETKYYTANKKALESFDSDRLIATKEDFKNITIKKFFKTAAKIWETPAAFIVRNLPASDDAFGALNYNMEAVREVRRRLYKEGMRGQELENEVYKRVYGTKDIQIAAIDEAKKELAKIGIDYKKEPMLLKRIAFELIQNKLDTEVQEVAKTIANENTFRGAFRGVTGLLATNIPQNALLSPFVGTIMRMAEKLVEYTPIYNIARLGGYSLTDALRDKSPTMEAYFKRKGIERVKQEGVLYKKQLAKVILSHTLLLGFWALSKVKWDDDDNPNTPDVPFVQCSAGYMGLSYKDREKAKSTFPEYTMRIGNFTFSYKTNPLAVVALPLGVVMDAEKAALDKSKSELLTDLTVAQLVFMYDATPIQGWQKFFESLGKATQGDFKETQVEDVMKAVVQQMASIGSNVAIPNNYKQLIDFTDPTKYEAQDMVQAAWKAFNMERIGGLNVAHDRWGFPVEFYPGESFFPVQHLFKTDEYKKITEWELKNRLNLPTLNRKQLVLDTSKDDTFKTKRQIEEEKKKMLWEYGDEIGNEIAAEANANYRVLTYDEWDKMDKEVRQAVFKQVQENFDKVKNPMTNEFGYDIIKKPISQYKRVEAQELIDYLFKKERMDYISKNFTKK